MKQPGNEAFLGEDMCWLNSLRFSLTVEFKRIVCTCPVQSPLQFNRSTNTLPCAKKKGDRNLTGDMRGIRSDPPKFQSTKDAVKSHRR